MIAKADQHLSAASIHFTALLQRIETARKAGLTQEETSELTNANVDACIAALDRAMDAMVAEADSK